jgi:hypothetical protein
MTTADLVDVDAQHPSAARFAVHRGRRGDRHAVAWMVSCHDAAVVAGVLQADDVIRAELIHPGGMHRRREGRAVTRDGKEPPE